VVFGWGRCGGDPLGGAFEAVEREAPGAIQCDGFFESDAAEELEAALGGCGIDGVSDGIDRADGLCFCATFF
jgi:hypothetical protein